ncbi:MAG: hypothetical protein OEV06_00885 [Anaerolineae bacterium]|nr:hypothetical protein [Anaerolineae bacterium]
MGKKKIIQLAAIALVVLVAGVFAWQSVFAAKPIQRKEVSVDYGDYYDISIGNSGVSQEEAAFRGTIQVEKYEHPPNYGLAWHVWTQNLMDVRFYGEDGRLMDKVYGIVQVYFDMDRSERELWRTAGSNMGIWYYDVWVGRWVKCPTTITFHLEDYPNGRLACPITGYGLYGIGWTQPTMEIKLTKADIP